MVNLSDLFEDKQLILIVNDMGYEVELDYIDEDYIRLKCEELEE